jgi:hypothetical protein
VRGEAGVPAAGEAAGAHRLLSPATVLLARPEALRTRLAEDGALYFPGLLPPGPVLALRREVLGCCEAGGWLGPGTDPAEGVADPARATVEPEPAFLAVYREVQKLEAFHALGHRPELLALAEAVLGEPVLPHPTKIARLSFPGNVRHTTPAHQDYPFIQGAAETYTTWVPLGDVPRPLGGLQVNLGTHRQGVYPHHISLGAGGMGIDPAELPDRWHTADYRAGDVLLFHSHMVHRALPNLTPDRLRLSVDFRYQPLSQPIAEKSLHPHTGALGWPEVYAGWRSTALQYYWRRPEGPEVKISGYDTGYFAHRDQEAYQAAARGDEVARPALLRIAQRDPDPAQRERAARALAELEARLAGG